MCGEATTGDGQRRLNVAVIDDDGAFRSALASLLTTLDGVDCVGQYASVDQLMVQLDRHGADVLLLDVNMPREAGSAGVRRIRGRHPEMAVLMLTAFSDDAKVFESICNGAVGYLLKTTTPQRLEMAIRDAAAGGAPFSPEISKKLVVLFQRTGSAVSPTALTLQESRLLALLARGYSYQAAANEMHVSVNTVRNYVRSVYEKLHVHSKGEAVARAIRQGLV